MSLGDLSQILLSQMYCTNVLQMVLENPVWHSNDTLRKSKPKDAPELCGRPWLVPFLRQRPGLHARDECEGLQEMGG